MNPQEEINDDSECGLFIITVVMLQHGSVWFVSSRIECQNRGEKETTVKKLKKYQGGKKLVKKN